MHQLPNLYVLVPALQGVYKAIPTAAFISRRRLRAQLMTPITHIISLRLLSAVADAVYAARLVTTVDLWSDCLFKQKSFECLQPPSEKYAVIVWDGKNFPLRNFWFFFFTFISITRYFQFECIYLIWNYYTNSVNIFYDSLSWYQ